jgi:uncharacterized protein involved in exopolysaccharide biosynthesis
MAADPAGARGRQQALLQDARRYLAVFHRRRGLIAACVLAGLVVAGIYSYTSRPLYQATAQIQIDRDAPNVLTSREVVDLGQAGLDYFQTQYQILRGRTLAERVVEKIGFQKSAELKTGPLLSPLERIQVRLFGKTPKVLLDKDGMKLSPAVAAFRSRLTIEPMATCASRPTTPTWRRGPSTPWPRSMTTTFATIASRRLPKRPAGSRSG